jgi:hypothetical protein
MAQTTFCNCEQFLVLVSTGKIPVNKKSLQPLLSGRYGKSPNLIQGPISAVLI